VDSADIYQVLVYSDRLAVSRAALVTPTSLSISYEFPRLERDRYVHLRAFGLTLEASRYKILQGIESLAAWSTAVKPAS
jgi:hypothetical protein